MPPDPGGALSGHAPGQCIAPGKRSRAIAPGQLLPGNCSRAFMLTSLSGRSKWTSPPCGSGSVFDRRWDPFFLSRYKSEGLIPTNPHSLTTKFSTDSQMKFLSSFVPLIIVAATAVSSTPLTQRTVNEARVPQSGGASLPISEILFSVLTRLFIGNGECFSKGPNGQPVIIPCPRFADRAAINDV